MKIALYIDDGREQIVLTPETKTEQAILGKMHDGSRKMSVYLGAFYSCAGGWVRHARAAPTHTSFRPGESEDRSTIIVLDKQEEANGVAA